MFLTLFITSCGDGGTCADDAVGARAEERKDGGHFWQAVRSFKRAEPLFLEAAHDIYLHVSGIMPSAAKNS